MLICSSGLLVCATYRMNQSKIEKNFSFPINSMFQRCKSCYPEQFWWFWHIFWRLKIVSVKNSMEFMRLNVFDIIKPNLKLVLTLHSMWYIRIVCHFQLSCKYASCSVVACLSHSEPIASEFETVQEMFDSWWHGNLQYSSLQHRMKIILRLSNSDWFRMPIGNLVKCQNETCYKCQT